MSNSTKMTYSELEILINEVAEANRHFTNDEFKSLARYEDGSIIELSSCFFLLSNFQKDNKLAEDDFSRIDELEEDMRCMMAEFL